MTLSIATGRNNDLVLDAAGNLAMVSGLIAVAQNEKAIMETRLSECPLNTTRGIPWFETVFDFWNPPQFENAARVMLGTIDGVEQVQSVSITKAAGVATYTATTQTAYSGEALTING